VSVQNPKKALFEQFAFMAKAMGHVHRLELLESLAQGERGVEALAKAAGISIANASQHLQQLRQAGLVTSRKAGTAVIYRLTGDDVIVLFDALQSSAANHLAKVENLISKYYTARDGLEPLSREALVAGMKEGSITLLDVRPPDEYDSGHVPGAINIPLNELDAHLKDLPEGREVVAYCRGTWCVLSFETVAALRKRGLAARRLEEGFPEWRAAGLPVESAPR
jgi:ArsR family transcriptional regulator